MMDRPFGLDGARYGTLSELSAGVLLLLVVVLLGVAAGLIASTADYRLVALLAAGLVGLMIAFTPVVLFWVTVITAVLVAGAVRMYLPELQGIRWLLPLGAWLLAAYAVGYLLYSRMSVTQSDKQPTPAMIVWMLGFILVMLISGLLFWPGAETFAKGLKGYFQMWGLLLALAFYPWSTRLIDRLPMFFLTAAWIQLPFVAHQYLVLVPARLGLGEGIVPVDIIAGTFGGQIEGGGDNAVLSVFLMIVLAGLLSAWRHGIITLRRTLLLGLPLLAPMALNVSKISIVYALIVFVMLFGADVARHPKRFVGTMVLFAGILAVLATAYTAFAPKELDTWRDLAEFTYEGNIAQDLNNEGDLTRGGALRYWFQQLHREPLSRVLFGYGPGATRPADEEADLEDFSNPVDAESKVGRLAVTAILWEGGLVGLFFVFGLFASAYMTAQHLLRESSGDPYRHALFSTAQVALVLLFVSLWHKQFFVFHVGYQTVFALILGYLAYWVRNGARMSR